MSTTINITEAAGLLVPDVSSVNIVAGESITFVSATETAVKLCMNAETAALLGTSSGVEITAGGSLTLTFGNAAAGSYGIALQFPDKNCPSKIGTGGAGTLSIEPARKGSSPIPPDEPDPPPSGNPGGDN